MTDEGSQTSRPGDPDVHGEGPLADSFFRTARKLRISVTDRCNFRCDFCMPAHPVWLDRREILSYEEIARVAGILAKLGVDRIRLSGGEPLVRMDVEKLVRLLSGIDGIRSVGMTTNGALLKEKAGVLKQNGLDGVTLSIHSLKEELYNSITGTRDMYRRVLDGLEEAKRVGLSPVKINCVVTRGCNEGEVGDFARMAHDAGLTVRFIEYMPFDGSRFWDMERVVSGGEIIGRIEKDFKLVPLPREKGATASTYGFADGSAGQIGVITSMTRPFCGDCDRIRMKANGMIVPCLFCLAEYDLKPLLRGGGSDREIAEFVRKSFWMKSEGVESMIKQHVELKRIRPMHTIGG